MQLCSTKDLIAAAVDHGPQKRPHLRQYRAEAYPAYEARLVRRRNRRAGIHGAFERMRTRKFASDDLHVPLERAHRARDTAGQTAAPEGNQDRLDVGRLRQDLERDGGVARQRGRVSHRINIDAGLTFKGARLNGAPPLRQRTHVDARSQAAQLLEFRLRCVRGDDGRRGDSEAACHEGHAKRAVARARGVDPGAQIRRRSRQHGVAYGPDLERPDGLQILELQPNGLAGRRATAAEDRRDHAQVRKPRASRVDLRHRDRLYHVEHVEQSLITSLP
jgi:hypothetical protein